MLIERVAMSGRTRLHLLTALSLALILPGASAPAQSERKALYAVLLDNSGSMEKQLPQVLTLGQETVERVHRRGPVALFNFRATPGDEMVGVWSGTGWSQDGKALSDYLRTIPVVRQGQVTILDVIHSMAVEVNAKAGAERDASVDKVIILITDGEHRFRWEQRRMSRSIEEETDEKRRRENQLVKALKESGIKVYAVGLVRELSGEGGFVRKSPREDAENFLRKLTKETGGRVVFPKSKNVVADDALNELLGK